MHNIILRSIVIAWVLSVSISPVLAWEKLNVPIPEGWHFQFFDSRGDAKAKIFLPPGQLGQNHTESLWVWTLLGFYEQKPEAVLKKITELLNRCPSTALKESRPYKDRGYEALYATAWMPSINTCFAPPPLTVDRGEVARIKFLRGNDNSYVIIRAWRSEPFRKKELAKVPKRIQEDWDRYFEEVYLYESNP